MRGGKAPRYADYADISGFVGEAESWHFHGSPTSPHPQGSTEYFSWIIEQSRLAHEAYTKIGFQGRIGQNVNPEIWKEAKAIHERYVYELRQYDGPRSNKDKNDKNSFNTYKENLSKKLEKAMQAIGEALGEEMTHHISERRGGPAFSTSLQPC